MPLKFYGVRIKIYEIMAMELKSPIPKKIRSHCKTRQSNSDKNRLSKETKANKKPTLLCLYGIEKAQAHKRIFQF